VSEFIKLQEMSSDGGHNFQQQFHIVEKRGKFDRKEEMSPSICLNTTLQICLNTSKLVRIRQCKWIPNTQNI